MEIHITAEDIERASRLIQNPFDSDKVWYSVYPIPVANDDGLFHHRDDYVPCPWCQPDPVSGEGACPHGHIIVEGSNGGVRCEPLTDDSLGRLVRDLRYQTPDGAAIQVSRDAHGAACVVLVCSAGATTIESPLPVTGTAADALERENADALGGLVARNTLFEDVDGDS